MHLERDHANVLSFCRKTAGRFKMNLWIVPIRWSYPMLTHFISLKNHYLFGEELSYSFSRCLYQENQVPGVSRLLILVLIQQFNSTCLSKKLLRPLWENGWSPSSTENNFSQSLESLGISFKFEGECGTSIYEVLGTERIAELRYFLLFLLKLLTYNE